MALKEGTKAPEFTAKADGDREISLSDYKGEWLVLYFYPKDNTSGCTKEACGFTENIEEFNKINSKVVGVSPDSVKSHDNFKEKYDLAFDLISDPEKEIAKNFEAFGEKKMYGKTYMGIIRSTFIIDPEGEIKKVYPKVRVKGHVENVMEDLKELQG